MKVYAVSNVGKVRPINEDSYYTPQEGECFCAVADGMGGHNAGEVASALAVETFSRNMRLAARVDDIALHDAVSNANRIVFDEASRDDSKSGMGTTFTALSQVDGHVHIAHVGDSRAYLIRNGAIMRVTMDHTLVEELILQRVITVSEAKTHPKRNYITRALGTGKHVEIDLIRLELCEGDVFLLCSDGLSNYVDERELLQVTLSDMSWEEKLDRLVAFAMDAGGNDNITAMYVTFEEEHR